jgi:hypothetical protein
MDDRDGARQKVALGQQLPANLPQLGPCAMRPRCAKFDHLATETENTQAMSRPETQRDDFAELYMAGFFADASWSVYFPRRDVGFDFIVTKKIPMTIYC